jgi:hypothetical protein
VAARSAEISIVGTGGGTSSLNPGNPQIVYQDGPFRIGNQNKAYWPLSVNTSPSALQVNGLSASHGTQDAISVTFSGPMFFTLPNGTQVDGGSGGQAASAAAGSSVVSASAVPPNYQLKCNDTPVTWPAGSTATYTAVDTVSVQTPSGQNIFNSGDNCELTVNSIQDPAGQVIRASGISVRIP